MAAPTKFQTHIEMKAQQWPIRPPRMSTELTMEEQQRIPFPLFRASSSKKKKGDTWIISLFVLLHLGAFITTMIVNDCSHNSHGVCALKSLGRFSFQPLSENPLLGPSASALDETGALRRGLLTKNHQLWRVFTSPLLHGGIFHLLINLSFVIFVGIHLEQEFGPLRTGIICIVSAITGSLVAALFIQDRPSVSSSAALFGMLGTLLSALIRNWNVYSNKFAGLVSVIMILMINLILGLVPYINNFSNIGGFISGFFLGFVLLFKPSLEKISQNKGGLFEFDAKHSVNQRMKLDKPVQRGVSLLIFALVVVGATIGVLHNVNVNKYCSWCHYFDCIPCKWWSCSDVTFHCEKMVSSDHLTISCLNNGRSRIFPFGNISQPRFQDLCYLICS